MRIIGIYKITNKANGKFYIGSSNNINRRWIDHRKMLKNNKHQNPHLQNAWNKYGENNFFFSIVVETSEDKLLEIEQKYLDENKINKSCYNTTFIAGKIEMTPEMRKKIGDGNRGKVRTEETKKKLSQLNKGKNNPMFGKKTRGNLGREFSLEWCNKIGNKHRGKIVSTETREKIRNSLLGTHQSDETKYKRSISLKKSWSIRKESNLI